MKISRLFYLFFMAGLFACNPLKRTDNNEAMHPTESSGVLVIADIVFSEKTNASQTIKSQCNLPRELAGFIEKNASGQYDRIINGDGNGSGDAEILTIEIAWAVGKWGRGLVAGADTWNGKTYGPRTLGIQGTLSKNGAVIGDFKALRRTGGGLFGDFRGSCSAVLHDAKALGKDVAAWLKNPVHGSELADY